MVTSIGEARAYLDTLEADWRAALLLSEQKAEEAKLIKARAGGFREALKILSKAIPASDVEASHPIEPARRVRRRIPQLIVRELSFSGYAMTTRQIADAIDYFPDRTETALQRMEKSKQVVRDRENRWAIGETAPGLSNGHAITGNGSHPATTNASGE
jgi:hypothetical protein